MVILYKKKLEKKTEASKEEAQRFSRISFQSIDDFNRKKNRKKKPNLTQEVSNLLKILCSYLKNQFDLIEAKELFEKIIFLNQKNLIETLLNNN